ncbi:MAG: helix-turn-helix domain-containing protein [Mesorhizobium sp.]|nr:MAG: helix-turn-helix domain-containing protein [Mesorhizobium sp.]
MPESLQKFGFLILDGFSNMVLASAVEPLRAANYYVGKTIFEWKLLSIDNSIVTSSSGISLQTHCMLDQIDRLDWLMVICGYGARKFSTQKCLAELRRAEKKCKVVGGLDAGAWLLAAAGLLTGRTATMHWLDLPAFQTEFTTVNASTARFVIDGNRVTAGGATTVMELMLRLIRDICCEAVAFDVSNSFVYNSERVEIDNRGTRTLSLTTRTPQLARAIAEMRRTLADPISLERLAKVANCSRRTLNRLFLRELNIPPGRYYELVRLAQARSLVEDSLMSAYEIAAETGYESGASLSKAYKKRFGVTLMSSRRAAKT